MFFEWTCSLVVNAYIMNESNKSQKNTKKRNSVTRTSMVICLSGVRETLFQQCNHTHTHTKSMYCV